VNNIISFWLVAGVWLVVTTILIWRNGYRENASDAPNRVFSVVLEVSSVAALIGTLVALAFSVLLGQYHPIVISSIITLFAIGCFIAVRTLVKESENQKR
jgi:hypothetical protein